jgi:hypothetical protein
VVPGDSVHVVWPLVLGVNRGCCFPLSSKKLSARGPRPSAWLARSSHANDCCRAPGKLVGQIAKRPRLAVRYARIALTQQLKRAMLENLGYGLALEGLGALGATAAARS